MQQQQPTDISGSHSGEYAEGCLRHVAWQKFTDV
jgi:hypothetical protein